uniref:Uncharacterized protein n=1 Tax=Anguilla anguilla TaxID=7936 RepID=A0A0E9RKJ0_ANGAN
MMARSSPLGSSPQTAPVALSHTLRQVHYLLVKRRLCIIRLEVL